MIVKAELEDLMPDGPMGKLESVVSATAMITVIVLVLPGREELECFFGCPFKPLLPSLPRSCHL